MLVCRNCGFCLKVGDKVKVKRLKKYKYELWYDEGDYCVKEVINKVGKVVNIDKILGKNEVYVEVNFDKDDDYNYMFGIGELIKVK